MNKSDGVRVRRMFVVSKEPHSKVISSTSVVTRRTKKGEEQARQKRSVQCIVRWFQRCGNRKTCSVFGMQEATKAQLNVMRQTTLKTFPDATMHFMGVLEKVSDRADRVGTCHAHICVFRVVRGDPVPLTSVEEKALESELNRCLSAWELRSNLNAAPFRWLRQKRRYDVLEEVGGKIKEMVYRVPLVQYTKGQEVVRRPSGMCHYAVAYSLKTLLRPEEGRNFGGSVGVEYARRAARETVNVRVKEKSIVNIIYATYRMDLVSYLVYEVQKQLTYRPADEVCARIKYGRLFVNTKDRPGHGNIRLVTDEYIKIGIELLRRYLRDFDGPSLLRRATVACAKVFCGAYTRLPTEELVALAHQKRQEIVWKARAKKDKQLKGRSK